MERQTRFNILYVVFAIFAVLGVQEAWKRAQTVEVVPYSEFERYLKEEKIAEVIVSD